MRLWLFIGSFIALVAILGLFFFDITTDFSFIGFLTPFWEFLENIASILKAVFDWFVDLIGWIAPNTVTA